jgi:hypothetical protein
MKHNTEEWRANAKFPNVLQKGGWGGRKRRNGEREYTELFQFKTTVELAKRILEAVSHTQHNNRSEWIRECIEFRLSLDEKVPVAPVETKGGG